MNTSKTIARNRIALASAVIWLSLTATLAHAADAPPASEFKSKVVQFGDLNLSSPTAVAQLYHRLVSAAQRVCDLEEHPRAVADQVRARFCVAQSVERAVTTINQPALSAFYSAKSGRPGTVILADRR